MFNRIHLYSGQRRGMKWSISENPGGVSPVVLEDLRQLYQNRNLKERPPNPDRENETSLIMNEGDF